MAVVWLAIFFAEMIAGQWSLELRFEDQSANMIAGIVMWVVVPFVALILGFRLISAKLHRFGRWIAAGGLVLTGAVLFLGVLAIVFATGGEHTQDTLNLSPYRLRLYQYGCGATCSAEVRLEQQWPILPGVGLFRFLGFWDNASTGTLELIQQGATADTVRVHTVAHYGRGAVFSDTVIALSHSPRAEQQVIYVTLHEPPCPPDPRRTRINMCCFRSCRTGTSAARGDRAKSGVRYGYIVLPPKANDYGLTPGDTVPELRPSNIPAAVRLLADSVGSAPASSFEPFDLSCTRYFSTGGPPFVVAYHVGCPHVGEAWTHNVLPILLMADARHGLRPVIPDDDFYLQLSPFGRTKEGQTIELEMITPTRPRRVR